MPFAELQYQQSEFMIACGQNKYPLHLFNSIIDTKEKLKMFNDMWLWRNLIHEEVNKELIVEIDNIRSYFNNTEYGVVTVGQLARIADGCIDSIYVILGLLNAMGINGSQVWDAVHTANMAKVGKDGKVIKRPDGKVLKPDGWKAPDIINIIVQQILRSIKNVNVANETK